MKPYYVPGLAILEPRNLAVDMTSKFPALMGLTFWEKIENKYINIYKCINKVTSEET